MNQRLLSEELQLNLLSTLADVFPSAINKTDYDEMFGGISNEVMLLNITKLIDDGLIEERAIIRLLRGPDINLSQLKLTFDGYQALSSDG
ncbi:hypothetical protein M942_04425 [Enterobacter ludwigii]|uniref:hypothetical protein n=1 Tax=Enterobacter ludwigii TaxID=299767 RepID=UPI0003D94F26|nr:hypothetical protein [Enterobacter ludwigii]AHE72541.1 hypothetical protein M942_04425 [Enterobacter ludwigii]